jgi:hypothetical protein
VAALVLIAMSGCQSFSGGGAGSTQVQFYSPPGATVMIKDGGHTPSRQIARESVFGDRLERLPEEASVFDLGPGHYEFKYVSATGMPGVSVYGELEVPRHRRSSYAGIFRRRSFVPISLPSEYYLEVESTGDQIFPYAGDAQLTAISEHDLERLRLGDLVQKVFFVADLEQAEEELAETEREIAVTERELEYAEHRFREAYFDFRVNMSDPIADLLGSDRDFIEREEERQECQQKLERLIAKRQRTKALLNGDHVLIRRGMLVLATEEVLEAHRDPVEAASELGEVVLVMRLGGRHWHWGEAGGELVKYEQ